MTGCKDLCPRKRLCSAKTCLWLIRTIGLFCLALTTMHVLSHYVWKLESGVKQNTYKEKQVMQTLRAKDFKSYSTTEPSIPSTSSTTTTTTTAPQVSNQSHSQREKRHIAYLKVHKTGSSTVQNIFLRFGEKRNLTFMLAHDTNHHLPNVISYHDTIKEELIVSPPPGKVYDVMCCHVIYNRTQFKKFMPNDTVYIGSTREPIKRLESAIRYFNMFSNANLSDVAKDPFKHSNNFGSMAYNRMAFEFGFPKIAFTALKDDPSTVEPIVRGYIEEIREQFDLLIVNERLDESLVLMKRLLGWHLEDIVYCSSLVGKQDKTRRFSVEDHPAMRKYLYLDFAVYNLAVEELDKKVNAAPKTFQEEVQRLKEAVVQIEQFCSTANQSLKIIIEASAWDPSFEFTRTDCGLCKHGEIGFIQIIRRRMYGRVDI